MNRTQKNDDQYISKPNNEKNIQNHEVAEQHIQPEIHNIKKENFNTQQYEVSNE